MDGSGASVGSGRGKLAVIKDSFSEQMFAFTLISLWKSSIWLSATDLLRASQTSIDEAAEF